ncbi:DUF2059 domain-containing protein [Sediminimonas sp.]|uniref:DUF2059 domain-containing protein n=1 Tax=Sediminimonas sp. TaxID=2823379 RepID=UPI0026015AC9|nr:DUF2059 domain-containing protein [Sediminimonas sp.]
MLAAFLQVVRRLASRVGSMAVAGLLYLSVLGAQAAPAGAQTADGAAAAQRLLDALRLSELVAVMAEEGLSHGRQMAADMLRGGAGAHLAARLARIYDPGRMEQSVRARFAEAFAQADRADAGPLIAFFTSAEGREIVALELAARRAFLDPEVQASARARYRALLAGTGDDARLDAARAHVAAGDLIDRNVAAALNANLAFTLGLIEGGALEMSREAAIAQVGADADVVRDSTAEWVMSYLLLAQDGLSVAQIEQYTALLRSRAGRAMNSALFTAFGEMYVDLSHAMGRALAAEMAARDL